MPNYPAQSLSDAQAKDIYAYIRSFTSWQPPPEKIPATTQILKSRGDPAKQKIVCNSGEHALPLASILLRRRLSRRLRGSLSSRFQL
jgi:hypothetical protein